ncbi:MAG: hypothetical protein U0270_20760 [Labilithrix sp.]
MGPVKVWTIWVDCVDHLEEQHALVEHPKAPAEPRRPIACTRNDEFKCFGHSNAAE